METIFVVGCETVVGANIAATHAEQYRVLAISNETPISIAGCESRCCRGLGQSAIATLLADEGPTRIIYCGAGARSSWQSDDAASVSDEQSITPWAAAARDAGVSLTVVSSDAVFTGPWMFHEEDCGAACPSAAAQRIRKIEQQALALVSDALIVRTHAIGWSTGQGETGWLESCVAALESGAPHNFDYIRHATPILATDLSEILDQAHRQGLSGTYHVSGSERINPAQLASRLASHFDLPQPQVATRTSLSQRPTGFGRGETSLQTGKIRAALDVKSPILSESLDRLTEQVASGYRDRLRTTGGAVLESVG